MLFLGTFIPQKCPRTCTCASDRGHCVNFRNNVICPEDCSQRCSRVTRKVLEVKPSCEVAYLYKYMDGIFGLGLKSKLPFAKGDFIMEYIGEQLTIEAAMEKIEIDSTENRITNYQVDVDKRYVVDGMSIGNLARFANASHVPNMKLHSKIVEGIWRCFYVAVTDIAVDDDLLAEYGFPYCDNRNRYVQCFCQADVCSGLISVPKSKIADLYKTDPLSFPVMDEDLRRSLYESEQRSLQKSARIDELEEELEIANGKIAMQAAEIMELRAELAALAKSGTSGNVQNTPVEDQQSPEQMDEVADEAGDLELERLEEAANAGIDWDALMQDGDGPDEDGDPMDDLDAGSQDTAPDEELMDESAQSEDTALIDDGIGEQLHDQLNSYRQKGRGAVREIKCIICKRMKWRSHCQQSGSKVQEAVVHFIRCDSTPRALARFFFLERELKSSGSGRNTGGVSIGAKEEKILRAKEKYDDVLAEMDRMT